MSCQFNSSATIFAFSTLTDYTWWIIIVIIIGHVRFLVFGLLTIFSLEQTGSLDSYVCTIIP